MVLTVTNPGPVIPPSALPTLFDPFVRATSMPRSNKRRSGIGLGLYIARQIVIAHGGSITVASSEATGTVFTVRLPRQTEGRSCAKTSKGRPDMPIGVKLEAAICEALSCQPGDILRFEPEDTKPNQAK